MVAPISQLANMEMALYGGFGTSMNAPSYLNGYMGGYDTNSYMNPWYGANSWGCTTGYNPTFGQSIPQGYANTGAQQQAAQGSVFQGLSQVERKALMNDYANSLSHTETFNNALISGGVGFALMSNPRLIAHPFNSFRATFTNKNATNRAFACFTDPKHANYSKNLQALWANPESNEILREAYLQHNKAVARANYSKLGWIRRSYGATRNSKAVMEIVTKLEGALKAGNMNKITEYTAQLKYIYGSNPGFLAKGVNWVKGLFGAETGAKTVEAALKDIKNNSEAFQSVKKGITTTAEMGTSFKKLATHGGWMGPATWVGFEFLFDKDKIATAFEKDNETGMKQLGQTTIKGLGSAAGWTLGEAAGKWAFAKWGVKIGSKVHPIFGTLIGGALGFIGGSLGMWLTGKGTKAIVGKDVADDLMAEKLAKTNEGQIQLLQNTMQRIQSGEKVTADAQMAAQKLMQQYA